MKDILRLKVHFSFFFKGVTVKNTMVNSTPVATTTLVGIEMPAVFSTIASEPSEKMSTIKKVSIVSVLLSKEF